MPGRRIAVPSTGVGRTPRYRLRLARSSPQFPRSASLDVQFRTTVCPQIETPPSPLFCASSTRYTRSDCEAGVVLAMRRGEEVTEALASTRDPHVAGRGPDPGTSEETPTKSEST